jgi:hypothetical protein
MDQQYLPLMIQKSSKFTAEELNNILYIRKENVIFEERKSRCDVPFKIIGNFNTLTDQRALINHNSTRRGDIHTNLQRTHIWEVQIGFDHLKLVKINNITDDFFVSWIRTLIEQIISTESATLTLQEPLV